MQCSQHAQLMRQVIILSPRLQSSTSSIINTYAYMYQPHFRVCVSSRMCSPGSHNDDDVCKRNFVREYLSSDFTIHTAGSLDLDRLVWARTRTHAALPRLNQLHTSCCSAICGRPGEKRTSLLLVSVSDASFLYLTCSVPAGTKGK